MFSNTRIGRSACLLIAFAVLSGCQPRVYQEQQLRNAAERGDAKAQYHIGLWCYYGIGVPMDQREAFKWWRRSAAQGYSRAQYNLGRLYGEGEGVTQDFVKAHAWMSLAAAQNYKDAAKDRDHLAGRMPPEQVAAAEKLASRLQEQIDVGRLSAEVEDTNSGKAPPSVPHGKLIVKTRSTEEVAEYSGEYFVMGFRGTWNFPARAMRLTFDQTTGTVVGQWDVKYKSINPENAGSQYPVGSGEITGDFDAQSGTLRLQLGGTTIFSGKMRARDNRVKEKVFRGTLSGGARGEADSLLLIQKLTGFFEK